MSDGMNKVILIGNLGADPELKYGQSGAAVLRLRLATSESWFDKNANERKSDTQWHSVVVFGKRGEALNKILAKGRTICVEGSLAYKQWTDKDGNKRTSTAIKAREVILLGGGQRQGERSAEEKSGGSYDRPTSGAGDDFGGGGGSEFGGDGIPFAKASRGIAQ